MRSGDTVRVHVKVREGDKERIQVFEGMVIGMHRGGTRASFTVRKVSFGQGVERIFPLHSPTIDKIEVLRGAKVRRAKLYFLRDLKGKAARMKEQKRTGTEPRPVHGASAGVAHARERRPAARLRRTSPASTKSGAAAWPGRSWRRPSSCGPIDYVPGVADSKVARGRGRERLYDEIVDAAVAWHVAIVEPDEIDRINIHRASLKAMREAVMALVPLPGFVLVDGFRIPGSAHAAARRHRRRPAIHRDRRRVDPRQGDPRSPDGASCTRATRATASIVTRATRPRDHLDAVGRFGYSAVHRRTFRPPSLFDTIPD